jgi:beta-galactosidase
VHIDLGIAGADFDNQEAHKTYPIGLPSPLEDAIVMHRHCYKRGIACGFVHPGDDLSKLKAFYIPHWVMWNNEWTPKLESFVENGGTLIIGAMTGTRDENNHIIREQAPGAPLSRLSGVKVEEFGRLVAKGGEGLFQRSGPEQGMYAPPSPLPSSSSERSYTIDIGGKTITVEHLYELLELSDDTQTIGTWSNRFAKGRPAITSRKLGKGRVIYVGTYLTEELASSLDELVLSPAGITPLVADLPEGVELSLRTADDRKLLFVLNTLETAAIVPGVPAGTDLLSGRKLDGSLSLEGYGCTVIHLS